MKEKYERELERYKDEQKGIEADARELERKTEVERHRADRFDLGEVFLEIALVVTSITLLTGRRAYWRFGIILGLVGLGLAATGLLVR